MKSKLKEVHYLVRPSTGDMRVVGDVFVENMYGFPDEMSGMTVLDVGAHIGTVAILCAERGADVFSLEPSNDNFDLLQKNIKLNGDSIRGKIVVLPWAIGEKDEKRNLDINLINPASNVLQGLTNEVSVLDKSILVEVRSLSSVFEELKIAQCDYLKLDCEGAEVELVEDIIKLHSRIKNIVTELHFQDGVQLYINNLAPFYDIKKMEGANNHDEYYFSHK